MWPPLLPCFLLHEPRTSYALLGALGWSRCDESVVEGKHLLRDSFPGARESAQRFSAEPPMRMRSTTAAEVLSASALSS